MKKIFKVIKNIIDAGLLGGMLSNKKANHPDAPAGSVNWGAVVGGIASSIALLALVYLLVTGKITFDEFKEGQELLIN